MIGVEAAEFVGGVRSFLAFLRTLRLQEPFVPLVSLVSMTSMVWSPSRSLMVLVVEASLPPRKSQLSQLPAMVSSRLCIGFCLGRRFAG